MITVYKNKLGQTITAENLENITVGQLFYNEGIGVDFIETKLDGDYYKKCDSFIRLKWNIDLNKMTPKQKTWVEKILEDCVEARIEG